ncbi:Sulfhydrogenase 1 subunit gamma [Thermoplasmatales archaeon]|nr:Sulfhydrogenase 1 subunit gamma [Thermoplasmatales archaeon]
MIHAEVIRIERNTPTVRTLYFRWDYEVKPGQFIMVWVPGTGEIPISLSSIGAEKSITVKSYGPASDAIVKLTAGSRLFFRGPYGRQFSVVNGPILLVGGGSGMASLSPLITKNTDAIVSARSADELLFSERIPEGRIIRVTDDGSAGIKGNPINALETVDTEKYGMIYVCGPEIMLKKVYDFLTFRKVRAEFALERLMKCGVGVCDSCSIDGMQLCRDGSIFSIDDLKKMPEFGRTKLTESGRRVFFNH